MSKQADTLLAEAMELPVDDRVRVASELLASLDSEVVDDDNDVEQLWTVETDRRAAMINAGEAQTFTRAEVIHGLAELRATRAE